MALTLAVATTVVTGFPTFLVAALFVQIASSVDAPVWSLGVVITVFWTAGALTSPTAGPIAARVGVAGLSAAAVIAAAVSLFGSAAYTPAWPWLAGWAAVGGVANAWGHPASNQLLATHMPVRRLALSYGAKQAAVPVASFIAGLAVPAVALTIGWRWAFGGAAALTAALLPVVLRLRPPRPTPSTVTVPTRIPADRRGALTRIAIVNVLAAGAATTTISFAVTASVHRGFSPAVSGILLTVASLIAATVRLAAGLLADRGIGGNLRTVGATLAIGAAGALTMAWPARWTFLIGLMAALGLGWGWPGLMHYVVSRGAGTAAAAATGLVAIGNSTGNAVVPLLVGLTYDRDHDSVTWIVVAALTATAAALALRPGRPTPAPMTLEATHEAGPTTSSARRGDRR